MVCDGCTFSYCKLLCLFLDEDKRTEFLQGHGLLPENIECPKCKKPCTLYMKDGYRFRCTSSFYPAAPKQKKKQVHCNYTASANKSSLFENAKLSVETICLFMVHWVTQNQPTFLIDEMGLSAHTVDDWSTVCREVCYVCLADQSMKLGGAGKTVEIDEAEIGKQKYNRGALLDSQWVFGGFERDTKRCFFVPVVDRSKETLLGIIKDWVLPGTTIVSDCWKAYDCLTDTTFQQESTNNSKSLVDPDTGGHTQDIERTWMNVRGGTPRYGRGSNNFSGYLVEYLFFKKYPDHRDRFHHFFKYVGQAYPPNSASESLNESANTD